MTTDNNNHTNKRNKTTTNSAVIAPPLRGAVGLRRLAAGRGREAAQEPPQAPPRRGLLESRLL